MASVHWVVSQASWERTYAKEQGTQLILFLTVELATTALVSATKVVLLASEYLSSVSGKACKLLNFLE